FGERVLIGNREVATWCQPLVEPMQEGLSVLAFKKINDIVHFLVQAKVECGNFDVVELAPTIQCLTGSYDETHTTVCYLPAFLKDQLAKRVLFDTKQSEEGGRFYHEQNRNVIIELNDHFDEHVPENFIWMTLGQIKEFLRFNNYLNIQVRSLISALDYME
ncbi:MAG: NDP-hexose 2,3-dehydratase family protein, partial [Oscillospiraceae bacterium]|nr:NDP-hexose 2,3-dehydratase family protein [Oscillospiraceae bacterium]